MGWGDELMVAGEARAMQRSDPRKVAVINPRRGDQVRSHAAWFDNPRIATAAEVAAGLDVQRLIAGPGARPYIAATTPDRWHWRRYRPKPGELYFSRRERRLSTRAEGAVIVEPHIKAAKSNGRGGASPNKQWGRDNWRALVRLVDADWVQLGPPGTPILKGIRHVATGGFREAAAVLAGARAAVLPEGGLHHAAAALEVPAVVLYGGFISPAETGYDGHVNLFVNGPESPCGWRIACPHCARAMAAIRPEIAAYHLEQLLHA